jgi:hypothetical protein
MFKLSFFLIARYYRPFPYPYSYPFAIFHFTSNISFWFQFPSIFFVLLPCTTDHSYYSVPFIVTILGYMFELFFLLPYTTDHFHIPFPIHFPSSLTLPTFFFFVSFPSHTYLYPTTIPFLPLRPFTFRAQHTFATTSHHLLFQSWKFLPHRCLVCQVPSWSPDSAVVP